jgi:hypothetical protein
VKQVPELKELEEGSAGGLEGVDDDDFMEAEISIAI